jgi:hypothetical protein
LRAVFLAFARRVLDQWVHRKNVAIDGRDEIVTLQIRNALLRERAVRLHIVGGAL